MLSIIIVSYNVKYFLEQCLYSVQKAIAGMDAEVIIADNNSADETVGYLKEKFSWVKLIACKENNGYAKANNLGVQMASGDYILFLNPDTLLSEDCLQKSVAMLEQDKGIGALGIRMLDGTGRFLPESKRGFPSPRASFFKLSGLIKLFPHSRSIAKYYMGHLPENKNNEVDVLAGAFLMTKKEVLQKTGGFDERFFMYGEDIDLSYRIKQAGYKNYYLAESSIIHFKGESTKKGMANTKLFYKAMGIFVSKHYATQSRLFNVLMQVAIAISGLLSFIKHFFSGLLSSKSNNKSISTIVAGSVKEREEALAILDNAAQVSIIPGHQQIKRKIKQEESITALRTRLMLQAADEIIFCAGTISYKEIIDLIESLNGKIDYKFFAAGSKSIVGSNSKNEIGETIVV